VDTKEKEDAAIALYPNPANQFVRFEFPTEVSKISVFDVSGKEIKQIETTSISTYNLDTQFFLPGVYIVKFITISGKTFSRKFVVTK
jgi:hypothetical protein